MSVPEQKPIVVYKANGSTTTFPVTFDLHDTDQLFVLLNNEVPEVSAYTVLNKEVVFKVAPKNGDEITVSRMTALERETEYKSFNNSFRPQSLNWDFNKIWHVLQESNLIDAKILSRLKEEIEWRRTHDANIVENIDNETEQRRALDQRIRNEITQELQDRQATDDQIRSEIEQEVSARRALDLNYDMLAQARDMQVFTALKQYLDMIIASTTPNIFGGVTAGVVFALDKKSVQTHLEEILVQLATDRVDIQSKANANDVQNALDKKASIVYVDTIVNAAAEGKKFFRTQTELLSTTGEFNGQVAEALDTRKVYFWQSSNWIDTGLSELDQAKQFANENAVFNPAIANSAGLDFNTLTKFGFHRFFRTTDWNNSTNKPPIESQWAMVLVLPVSTGVIGQLAFCLNSLKMAFRFSSNTETWSDWSLFSNDTDFQSLLSTNNPILSPKAVSSTTGVDFNTLNTFGFHKFVSGNAWNNSINKPDLTDQWAFALVLPISTSVIFQFVFCLNANVLYFRSSTNATTWAAWKKLSGDASVLQSALTAAQAAADTKVNELKTQLPSAVDSHLSPKFEIGGKNFFDPLSIVLGKTISSSGVITDNKPNGVISGVIDVVGKTNLYVSGLQVSSGYRAIVFLREDGTVAQVQSIGPNLTEKLFVIPQNGAVKAQMCIKEQSDTFTLDTSTIQFEFSGVKTEYEPFKRGPLKSIYGVELSSPIKPGERFIKSRAFGASYLLFGDSITETSNVDSRIFNQTSYRKNWPTWAVDTLQMGTFRNYAKSGAAFKDRSLEPRYQYLYNQVVDAIANNENPDVIVVACGTNDGMGNVGTYEAAMSKASLEDLDQLKTLEAARWVFWKLRTQYPDAICFYANPLQRMANTTEELAPLVDGLGKMAQRHGFILIDQNKESGIIRELEVASGEGKYLADGLHPNDLGRQRQANLIVSKIVSYMSY